MDRTDKIPKGKKKYNTQISKIRNTIHKYWKKGKYWK